MSSKINAINGKDLINIGVFTAIIFIVNMFIGPIGFIVFLLPLYSVLIPLVSGIPWMLFSTKIRKFGMILIMDLLLAFLLMLTGMGWYAFPVSIISGLISEYLIYKGNYQSIKMNIAAYSVFSLWVFGSFIPLIFMADKYWETNAKYGTDYIIAAKELFQLWMAPVLIVSCLIFGLLGGVIGTKVMKKHFVKAGIV